MSEEKNTGILCPCCLHKNPVDAEKCEECGNNLENE